MLTKYKEPINSSKILEICEQQCINDELLSKI